MVRFPSSVLRRLLSVHTFKYLLKTPGPSEVRFYMEHLYLAGTKDYIISPGHMTKIAAMPIYDKNLLKIFFSKSDDLETWQTANGTIKVIQ